MSEEKDLLADHRAGIAKLIDDNARLRAELEALAKCYADAPKAFGKAALTALEERDSARALLAASQARVVELEGALRESMNALTAAQNYRKKMDGHHALQITMAQANNLSVLSPAPSAAPEPKEDNL